MAKEEASAVVSEGVREGLAAGSVIQTRQSFTAKGHTFAKPADITLGIEELAPPSDPASKAAKVGDVVDVAYVGKHPDGAVFEESTLVFVLGAGDVIKAWDEGIVGMRVGQQARPSCTHAFGSARGRPAFRPKRTQRRGARCLSAAFLTLFMRPAASADGAAEACVRQARQPA